MQTADVPGAAASPIGGTSVPWRTLTVIALASFAVCALADLTYFAARTDLISEDERRFLDSAQHLLATGTFRVGALKAFEMPGTAAFFAALTWAFPAHALLAIRLAQGALVALQSVFVGALSFALFRSAAVAILASLMAAFYPYFIFTQGMALSETLFMAFMIAGFLSLYRWRAAGARIGWGLFVTMALFVAATMVKATLSALAPILLIVAAIGVRKTHSLVAVAVAATLSFVVLMAPWWTRNYLELGTFVPFTTTSSLALYAGNTPENPDADALWDYKQLPQMAIPDELARSRALRDAALAHIAEDPAGFVKRATLKFIRFWSLIPRAQAFQNPLYLIVGGVTFAPILLLAMICAFSQYRRFVEFLPIYLVIAYFTAVYTITVASIRYRLPIEPLLIVLASYPGMTILTKLAGLRRPRLQPAIGNATVFATRGTLAANEHVTLP
jgi:4-amino-4-deoxy-L-arabinose transferase-like glycosyltransferase